jgi:hypothetical protein
MNEISNLATIKGFLFNTCNDIEVVPISNVNSKVDSLLERSYLITKTGRRTIIDNHLNKLIETLKDNLYVAIESPYVDKTYRDTYYKYYSSKLNPHYRDCIRLSFFDKEIKWREIRMFPEEIDKQSKIKNIMDHYLGFLVLRPTFPKIIGRNAISPKAKKVDNILCCQAKIGATVGSIKQKISAFPHASQDGQTMTCAETTIWSLMEYFGNKYPEYKPVLFSQINTIIHKFSYKRLLPSDGLTAEQITFTIRELGFGSVIYSKLRYEKARFQLDYIISSYVESGIPIIAIAKNKTIGHVLNIIGREMLNSENIAKRTPTNTLGNGTPIIDFNKIKKKYVLMDDNYPPYQLTELKSPFKSYYTDKDWHDCQITNIVVPLHSKIYLDVTRASMNFYNSFESKLIGINDGEQRIVKIFLASSRSYKQYIALNKNLHYLLKELILCILMPKFIWVAEVSKKDSFIEGMCNELYIQDATEPMENTAKNSIGNQSILAAYSNDKFFSNQFGEFKEISIFASPFNAFEENLN